MAAGHDEKKKAADASDDLPILSADNLQNNMKIIYYSRTFLSIIGGVIAGILGLTGLTGFICYFLVMAIASLGFVAKANFSINAYFNGWSQIILDGFLSGLMSFVLFWTYGIHPIVEGMTQMGGRRATKMEFCTHCTAEMINTEMDPAVADPYFIAPC